MNGWDVACYIFGTIALVGPLFIVVWYFRAAKQRIQDMNKEKGTT
mgnify:CR=1 FL=1